MAYTTDKTWAAGSVVLASDLQTYVSNNLKWLSTDKPMARAYSTVDVNITTGGTGQGVALNTNRFDNASVHNVSSNNTRMTVPSGAAGKWLFGGHAAWATGSVAGTSRQYQLKLNGATYLAVFEQASASNTVSLSGTLSSMYSCAAADYVELVGYQDSGGTIAVKSFAAYSPECWALWVGI